MVAQPLRESTTREKGFALLLIFASFLGRVFLPPWSERLYLGVVRGIGLAPAGAVVAACGYERTRSVWVPAAAFAVYFAVLLVGFRRRTSGRGSKPRRSKASVMRAWLG